MTGTIGTLAIAVAAFVVSHVALSSPPVRTSIVAAIGERGFLALYSLIALALLAWITFAYRAAPVVDVWIPPIGLRHLSLVLMLFACLLLGAGLTTPNPTAVGANGRSIAAQGPVGVLKVTRHPVMWGIALWGIAHLLANGDAAGMILFGGMTLLALGGALAIDAKKRASLGADWDAYRTHTSYVPFVALIARRARVGLAEIGYGRLALGLVLYAVLLLVHPWLFGVSPLPI